MNPIPAPRHCYDHAAASAKARRRFLLNRNTR